MPLDTCITNVGDYYSAHYLDSTFAGDLKEVAARWRKQGSQAVPKKIQALSPRYFRAKTAAITRDAPEERPRVPEIAGWHGHLLGALGYGDIAPLDLPDAGEKTHLPTLGRIHRYGKPWLVICETVFCLPDGSLREGRPSENPLEFTPLPAQLNDATRSIGPGNWEKAIGRILTAEDAPRWVLFLAGSQVSLFDGHTFAQGRYLAFDIDDAFGRGERDTFPHIAAFLSAETLCPGGETDAVLHDRIEARSHRFAHGVTDALQIAVRKAIQLLANEWVEDRRRRKLSYTEVPAGRAGADGNGAVTAERLRREALIFVYRLLFCFYAEARGGELGILPIGDDAYRLGYSLEALRDLELTPLTPATEAGLYFDRHLKRLFAMIHEGFNPEAGTPAQMRLDDEARLHAFSIQPLTATLFDPNSMPLLNGASFTNRCLQQVIRLLSLSKDDKSKTTGRVNYAELGINQIGAVYEGLLAYRGRFVSEDMIQVKPAKGSFDDKKTPTWFVPKERIAAFEPAEIEPVDDPALREKPRIYPMGSFILHLSGVERERTASYYTPETLTRCVVQESLRELLRGWGPPDADKILALTICEMAMGSGAFLNEVAGQLAARYLELKQKQTGRRIDPGRYADELRRTRHYIITRNVYGVDLNDTAVELGALSLWLGGIHRLRVKEGENGEPDRFRPGATPWFGMRLRCGNSLIGARRAVWRKDQLARGLHFGTRAETPRALKPGEARKPDEIYHFLVFDEEMAPATRYQLMRGLKPEACEAAKSWRTETVKPKWSREALKQALEICDRIDALWLDYSAKRRGALEKTACTATVWPTPDDSETALAPGPPLDFQEGVRRDLEGQNGAFQRLKLLMDAWCALWFWPLAKMAELPGRESFLAAAGLLLGEQPPHRDLRPLLTARLGFDVDLLVRAAGGAVPDAEALAAAVPWFGIARDLAETHHFHHWELVFPEVLGPAPDHPGMDLIVGNPPWIKASWQDAAVLADIDPMLGVRAVKSAV